MMQNPNPMGVTRADEFVIDAPQVEMRLLRDFALLMSVAGAASTVIVGALLAAVIGAAPAWIALPLFVGFGFSAIVSIATVKTLVRVRSLVEAVLWEWRENQKAAREIAHITATQTTNVSVKGRSNIVSVNSQGQGVENIRLVPVRGNTRLIDNVPECDLLHFVERALIAGHSKRVWLGAQLPSGKLVSTFEDYNQLVAPLVKANIIADRGERSAGHFTSSDAGEIKRLLGLPNGEQVEVKEIAGDRHKA